MSFDGHSDAVFTVYWSNNILVSGSADTSVICWNARNGDIIRVLTGNGDHIQAVGLFEGFVYAGGSNCIVFKWNIDSGEILKKFAVVHTNQIRVFAYRPMELFTGSIDTTVVRWDATSGNMLFQYKLQSKKLRSVVSWKYFVISAGADLEINVWDASINSAEPLIILISHREPINCLSVADDFLYSGSSDKTVNQWDLKNLTLNRIFEGYPDAIISLTAEPSFIFAAGMAGVIYQWNVSSGLLIGSFEGHTDDVYTLKLSINLLFSGSKDKTLRVWNAQIPEVIKVLQGKAATRF